MVTIPEIIDTIQSNPKVGIDLLVAFTREKAEKRDLYYQSVLLKSKLNNATGNDERSFIKEEMMTMVSSLKNGMISEDSIKERQEALEEKRRYFIDKGYANEIVLECNSLKKEYKKTNFTLGEVNLQVRLGEITGIVGENGNGKTTLMKLLSGELKPNNGTVSYNPAFIDSRSTSSVQRAIAFLPQEPEKVYGKVLTSIKLSASIYGIRGKENEFEVNYIIHRLGLNEYMNVRWNELSGGYKLRFALAKILVRKPRVLILDEPLANLDINAQHKLLCDLRDISHSIQNPVSIILSSQQLEEIEAIADNMVFLSKGKVLYCGPTTDLGNSRKENCFEIKTSLSRKELSDKLRHFPDINLVSNGISYLLTTPLDIKADEMLDYLTANEIPVHYFNDISCSSKKILYKLSEFNT